MAKIINSTYITLDGVVEGPHLWPSLDRPGDERSVRIQTDLLLPKYVVSTTLSDPDWANTQVIDGDVAARVRELKEEYDKDIVQYGFGSVSRLLLEHGLLDELRLWVHPLILGHGTPGDLLFGAAPAVAFELTDATTLSDGIVVLSYRTDQVLA